MIQALLRVALVTLAVLTVTAGLIFMVRQTAHPTGQNPPHPWFDRTAWDVRGPPPDQLCSQPPAAAPNLIYLLPVRKGAERWEVKCAAAPAVDAFLSASAHGDWLIELDEGAGEDLDNFVDIVSNVSGKRIGISSRSQRAARALRKKAPNWVFAADDASLMRLHLFAGMFLESVFDFWPDFVIANGSRKATAGRLTEREAEELKRRHKRILWDATASRDEAPFAVDGILRRTLLK